MPEVTEKLPLVPLEPLREAAQRMLDGQTVNRDRFALDVQALVRENEFWREKYAADVAMAN